MTVLDRTNVRKLALAASIAATVATTTTAAEADLPAPPGIRRVSYGFTVRGEIPPDLRLVAYPAYIDGSSTPELAIGREYALHQGYQPALYAIAASKMGDFPRDQKEAETWLAANAKRCLEKVPRVFSMKEEAEVLRVKDELRIESMSVAACSVVPVSTIYERTEGEPLTGTFTGGTRVLPTPLEGALEEGTGRAAAAPAKATDTGATTASGSPAASANPATGPAPTGTSVGVGCGCLVGAREAPERPFAAALTLGVAAIMVRRSRRTTRSRHRA